MLLLLVRARRIDLQVRPLIWAGHPLGASAALTPGSSTAPIYSTLSTRRLPASARLLHFWLEFQAAWDRAEVADPGAGLPSQHRSSPQQPEAPARSGLGVSCAGSFQGYGVR